MGFTADFPPDAHVVGIDLSEVALARHKRLDERILGNIETYPFPAESFDLVVCHYVLEHVDDPVAAIRNLASAVKPGGELDVQVPILGSVKGLVTKFTPHRFHVWCYRTLLREPNAGKEGYGPFPTTLTITPKKLERELASRRFDRISVSTWRASVNLPRVLSSVWDAVGVVERVLLPGRGATEYRARFRKARA